MRQPQRGEKDLHFNTEKLEWMLCWKNSSNGALGWRDSLRTILESDSNGCALHFNTEKLGWSLLQAKRAAVCSGLEAHEFQVTGVETDKATGNDTCSDLIGVPWLESNEGI